MSEARPNPDLLLEQVQAEEERSKRGKLKIFFGAAPGVGKTFSMLEAARKEKAEGRDVVLGYVEPHARPETLALMDGLEVLPSKSVVYQNVSLREFDLEAALKRHPALIVVDELAHTNSPGSTHTKRWQDVMQLLHAGVDVYSTLNVQHIESLNDIIAKITGIAVRETVPDSVFDVADDVELVDLPPDELMERLRQGKVYITEQAERAIQNFLRKGNLIALRELALRQVAERVNAEMEDYRRTHEISKTWPTNDRLLVCVSSSPDAPRIIRAGRRLATTLRAPWIAVYIGTPLKSGSEAAARIRANLDLAERLGAETTTLVSDDVIGAVVDYAHRRNVTKIIVGKSKHARIKELLQGSFLYDLTRECGDIDVYLISGEGEASTSGELEPRRRAPTRMALAPYVYAVGTVAIASLVGAMMLEHVTAVNLVMPYLIAVVIVSLRAGRGPSILASVLAVIAFDFFFVPPHLTFAVEDTEYLLTFGVMLATGLVISTLTGRLKVHAQAISEREQRTAALYSLSRQLSGIRDPAAVSTALVKHVSNAFSVQAQLFGRDASDKIVTLATSSPDYVPSESHLAVVRWVFENREKAGLGTDTLPGSDALYFPVSAGTDVLGVVRLWSGAGRGWLNAEEMRLLEAFCGQAAIALEQVHASQAAERIKVQIETERLRNTLLSAVSHDLRTPLTTITGASTALLQSPNLDRTARDELVKSIIEEAETLNRVVGNLLDATRLEAGGVSLALDWQSLEELTGAVLKRLDNQLQGRTVITNFSPRLPLVRADGVLIQQVLLNLLENAVAYSPPGTPIEISAFLDYPFLSVDVADRGRGLPPGAEQRIFEKFYRAGDAGGRKGAGLGLAICRGIVELHGGSISAENRRDGGTVIRFSLPVEKNPPRVDEGQWVDS